MSKLIQLYPLKDNLYAIVDDEDYPKLSRWNWRMSEEGYAYTSPRNQGKRKLILMHRLVVNPPDLLLVDHINSNRLDNQKENLRVCDRLQNSMNIRKYKGTSKYKGVSWKKARGVWMVTIRVDKKTRHLGEFKNEVEAARAYDAAAKRFFGEFAWLNFPDK